MAIIKTKMMLVEGIACCMAVAMRMPVAAEEKWNMFDRRLGMFVHWGIYSVGEWHEQEHMRKHMSRADYEKFKERFTAEM